MISYLLRVVLVAVGMCVAMNYVYAKTPAVMVDGAGVLQLDTWNERWVGSCWGDVALSVYIYKDANGKVTDAEVCNEPDESVYGKGADNSERARNYADFLHVTSAKLRAEYPGVRIVLGSLSGYNYAWTKEFLNIPHVCGDFDIFAFHPYHLGVPPDEIDISKDAWHTVGQWVGFYERMLNSAGCGGKMVWVTEYGYTTAHDNAEHAVSSAEQAEYAMRELIVLLGSGVSRVEYFDGLTYGLSAEGEARYVALAQKLAGKKLVSVVESGERYCPRGGRVCLYDDSAYRADSGITDYGVENVNDEKMDKVYTFADRLGNSVLVSWSIGVAGVQVQEVAGKDMPAFPDTVGTAWERASMLLRQRGIALGYRDGMFHGDLPMKRAEFLALALRGAGVSDSPTLSGSCFPDVAVNAWYAGVVCAAKQRGIVNGYADGNFHAERNVTRAEGVKMLLGAWGVKVSAEGNPWYARYVEAARGKGIGVDGDMGIELTRGEMAEWVGGLAQSP